MDSERERFYTSEIVNLGKSYFQPYMFGPEKYIFCALNEKETFLDDLSETPDKAQVGNREWCKCFKCLIEEREIHCLGCQEVDTLNSKSDHEDIVCTTKSPEFETLYINELVLMNILAGLDEKTGDFLEKKCCTVH